MSKKLNKRGNAVSGIVMALEISITVPLLLSVKSIVFKRRKTRTYGVPVPDSFGKRNLT